jgi:mono/diheme cytochrome c family protein
MTLCSKLPAVALTLLAASALLFQLTSCKPAAKPPTENTPATKLSFTADVRPLLEKHCINCHHDGALMGDLKLQNRATAFAPRAKGAVIIPGNPEKSPFFQVLVLPGANPKAMPPEGHQIPTEQIAIIKRWITEGADWPEGPEGVVKPSPALK